MKQKTFEKKLQELKKLAAKENMNVFEELNKIEEKFSIKSGAYEAWKRVEMARHPDRPTTLDYINYIFDQFVELHGDRYAGDDNAMIGGIALFNNQPVTVIGHQKGGNLKENIHRNYGMAQPEGYRKALRLAQEAALFKRPIVTFIDTPGAYPGLSSEERGIGEAIARNLREFSTLETPIICIVIGEGGSGGALGIGVGDMVFMLENSIYSVISPEGCASILLRDAGKAKMAADLMKLTAADLFGFGIIDGIIEESGGGANVDPEGTAQNIKRQIRSSLTRIKQQSTRGMLKIRSDKILARGSFYEKAEKKESILSRLFNKK